MEKKSIFSDRLVALRKEKGLTQAEVAEGIGVSRQSITLYESGSRLPDVEILTNIAQFFEVSSDYLLGLESCTNHVSESIQSKTGLSEDAIKILLETSKNVPGGVDESGVFCSFPIGDNFQDVLYLSTINEILKEKQFVNALGYYLFHIYNGVIGGQLTEYMNGNANHATDTLLSPAIKEFIDKKPHMKNYYFYQLNEAISKYLFDKELSTLHQKMLLTPLKGDEYFLEMFGNRRPEQEDPNAQKDKRQE